MKSEFKASKIKQERSSSRCLSLFFARKIFIYMILLEALVACAKKNVNGDVFSTDQSITYAF